MTDRQAFDCDILIRNARVIDGTGTPPIVADVAATGDEITAIGPSLPHTAQHVIDARGLCLAPGFIDVHTHDDWAVLRDPEMAFKITQGVTTVVAGNCGISAAPFLPGDGLPPPFRVVPGINSHSCATVKDYARAVAQAQPAVNVQLLAGHSSLRAMVMGYDLDRPATADEIERMASLLDHALQDGAIGLSSGLDYPAAQAAPMDEVVTLARVVAGHKGAIYTTHIRDEADGVIDAVREALDTAGQARAPLLISHHKCAGQTNFGKSTRTLPLIDAARQTGQDVAMDVYPYTASSSALIPHFAQAAREVLVIWSTPHPETGGRLLHEIAADWGLSQQDTIERLSPAGAIYFDMDEGDLQRIMRHPATMIGSDGLPGTQKPHPRLWGTFPRVLGRYVRELQVLDLTTAIHKMTGLSAGHLGLSDRGRIAPGKRADLVLFDPDTVLDQADFDHSEQPSLGISHVMVNGEIALDHGIQTKARSGRFLARG